VGNHYQIYILKGCSIGGKKSSWKTYIRKRTISSRDRGVIKAIYPIAKDERKKKAKLMLTHDKLYVVYNELVKG
jgi:hypothetical protein